MNPLEWFARWLATNLGQIWGAGKEVGIELVNQMIAQLATVLDFLTSWLPDYTLPTFTQLSNDNQALTLLNFFVPVDVMVVILGMWLTSEVLYIGVAPVLRWFKLIGR